MFTLGTKLTLNGILTDKDVKVSGTILLRHRSIIVDTFTSFAVASFDPRVKDDNVGQQKGSRLLGGELEKTGSVSKLSLMTTSIYVLAKCSPRASHYATLLDNQP